MSGLTGLESSCTLTGNSQDTGHNLYESGLDLSSPSPLCLSEGVRPYSPIRAYPPAVNSPSRFPPPPSPGFSQTYPLNMTAFEGPSWFQHSSHPSPEPVALYDHWPESGVSSVSGCGLDSGSKFMSQWPSSSGTYVDYSKYPSTAEPSYPTVTSSNQYPLVDSTSNTLVPRFSSPVVEQSTVSPSTAVPSVCASKPLFTSASTQTTRPHLSNRFSFNPHASAFYPGMYSQTPYGHSEDFSLYCEPSFTSHHLAPTDFLFTPEQGVDSFYDASSRPVHSPETAPRPISSTARSLFPGLQSPAATSNPSVAPPLSSRTDYCGLSSSSDGSGTREFSCDFPPASSLSFKLPTSGASLFSPYHSAPTAAPHCETESAEPEEDEMMEQAVKEAGTLLYRQTVSPEEWRWSVYETQHLSPCDEGVVNFPDYLPSDPLSAYNYFKGVERIGQSCMNEAAVTGNNTDSFFALGLMERPKVHNQGGPSLKLAASALAEMLATTSTGRSMIAHVSPSQIASSSLHGDDTNLPVVDHSLEALHLPWLEEKAVDDCCSSSGSSGSVAVVKEANEAATREGSFPYESNHCQPIGSQNRSVGLANPDTSGQSQNSTAAWRPTSVFINTVPEVRDSLGFREFHNQESGSRFASSTGGNVENIRSDHPNPLLPQSVEDSDCIDSGTTRRLTTQTMDAVFSGDDDSVSGGSKANVTGVDSSARCQYVWNGREAIQVPLRSCSNFGTPGGSSSLTAVSPPADPPAITTADEVAAKLLASFSLLGPRTVDTMRSAPTHHSTVLQSITTSISNLTKVLLATHSSSFPQFDMAPVQQSLQGSILGLSQCLLLEQAKVDRDRERVASNSAEQSGLNDLTGYGQLPADIAMENSEAKWPGEAQDHGNESHFKVAFGVPVQGQSSLHHCPVESRSPSNATGSGTSGMTTSDNEEPLLTDRPEKTLLWTESVGAMSRHFHVSVEAQSGLSNDVPRSDRTDISQQHHGGDITDIVQFLRERDLINLPALKKLVAAEEREKDLLAHIQDLQEQLEFQEEENRGAAYLCGAIMQESELRASKLHEKSLSATGIKAGESAGTTEAIGDHLRREGEPKGTSESNLEQDEDDNSRVNGVTEGVSDRNADPKGIEDRSFELDRPYPDGIEARLAILLERRGRDTGEVAGNETGKSSSPEIPVTSDLDLVKEALNHSLSPGLQDDEHTFNEKAPSGLASHMLKQSEMLYNIDAAWNKCYDFEGSQCQSGESGECESNGSEYPGGLSIEKRAEIIRSRCTSSRNDTVKSGNEVDAGGADYQSLLGAYDISGLSLAQDCWLDNILGRSDVTLEDLVHSDDGHRQQVAARDTTGSGETQGSQSHVPQLLGSGSGSSDSQETWLENIIGRSGVTIQDLVHLHNRHDQRDVSPDSSLKPGRTDSYDLPTLSDALGSDKEAMKSMTPSQDSEEESGWEHVRLPRQMTK
ncbi:hypothetical protein R1sor_011816 [Riccia sorocarpa]|uniref:Uncharacterized protein n=1 Tax=Riccia sorocarpa TaxID=122646 RepID=A0ABD3I1Z1_9MARC